MDKDYSENQVVEMHYVEHYVEETCQCKSFHEFFFNWKRIEQAFERRRKTI